MEILFYIAGAVAVISTALAVMQLNAVRALLYLIVSLLGVAVVFFSMGAPLVAALEVIVYAGAIMILFVFVIMMLNLGKHTIDAERELLRGGTWVGPAILSLILLAEVLYLVARAGLPVLTRSIIEPKAVGIALYGPYLLGVELASMLLLAALVGASHLGLPGRKKGGQQDDGSSIAGRADSGGDLVHAGVGQSSHTA